MRAFAKTIGLSSGGISRVLNGNLRISAARAKEISEKLRLTILEEDLFQSLLEAEAMESKPSRQTQYLSLTRKICAKIGIWKRLQQVSKEIPLFYSIEAITLMNLLRVGLKPTRAKELALLFNKSEFDIEQLIDRLRNENWISGEWGTFVVNRTASLFAVEGQFKQIKELYRSLFHLCMDHIEHKTADERVVGFESIVIDDRLWPELKEITHGYLDRVAELSQQSQNPNLVVQSVAGCFVVHSSTLKTKGKN